MKEELYYRGEDCLAHVEKETRVEKTSGEFL
jgi:hypothetical protein